MSLYKDTSNPIFLLIICVLKQNIHIFASAMAGTLAQLVEQWTENPCVPGSIPGGTTKIKAPQLSEGLFCFQNKKKLTEKTGELI
tara:strand:+ start:91 stop:345 length:255 start_codon:yes stop_codon:yes gene_type:complete